MVVEVLVPLDVIRIVKLASQQCTQMPQNGSERPVSPICVHSCESPRSLARSSRVATVYTNAPKRHREARSSHLCTLLRSQGHPQPKPTAQPCTRMPQNGTEGPFPPICVHSCVAPHGGDAHHAARAVTQPPTRTHEAPVPGTSLAHNWQLDGVPAWPGVRSQRGPLPRLRLSVRPGPKPRPAGPRRNPPPGWRGVARARLPSWAIFHSAPQAGGGLCPTPPGRRRNGKAHSAQHGSRRLRLFVRRRSGMCPSVGPRAAPAPSPAGLAIVTRGRRPMGLRSRAQGLRVGDGSGLCPAG